MIRLPLLTIVMVAVSSRLGFYGRRSCTSRNMVEAFSSSTQNLNHEKQNLWESSSEGNIRTVMAPMVAQSDLAFRQLCRKYGTDVCFTQMVHASNYVRSPLNFGYQHLDVYGKHNNSYWNHVKNMPSVVNALEGMDPPLHSTYQENGPVIVQLAGNDVHTVTRAAKIIIEDQADHDSVSGFDLNCGCPQSIARKGRYGAFLMEESVDTVASLVSSLKETLPSHVAVSVKMRLPSTDETGANSLFHLQSKYHLDILKTRIHTLIDAGMDSFTLHGRTLVENKTKVRACHWDAIAKAVQIARDYSNNPNYPVIANGGIEYSSNVQQCLQQTGATAVMSSEALLENPGIFSPNAKDDTDLNPYELFSRQLSYSREYLSICASQYPPIPGSLGKVGGCFNTIRAHLFKFLYRYLEEQPDLRSQMGNSYNKENGILTIQQAFAWLDELEQRYTPTSWEHNSELSSSSVGSSWYRRHRSAMSKVHVRGGMDGKDTTSLSTEQKKVAMKIRIAKMKEQRLANEKN